MSFLRGALFGLAGGAAGLVAMHYAMKATSRLLPRGGGEGEAGEGDSWALFGMQRREGETATSAAGRVAYERLLRRAPSEELVEKMSDWVHWAHGESVGALFGGAAAGRAGPLAGAGYGLLLWLVGDELMVPLLGLSKKPTATPLGQHVPPLVGHLAFGVVLGATVQALCRALPEEESAR